MYSSQNADVVLYNKFMEALKKENENYISLRNSSEYKFGNNFENIKRNIKKPRVLFKKIAIKLGTRKVNIATRSVQNVDVQHNYYSQERVAIYTAIFGKYDELLEPVWIPDNCDFYIFTDQDIPESSCWKKIEITGFPTEVVTNPQKNRYCKMFPHQLDKVSEYKYSIYIDGNIQVITDLTEFINNIGEKGIACHLHSLRDCVYDECNACIKYKNEKKENILRHIAHLEKQDFPHNYGMCECNVIARDNTSVIMRNVMKDWWKEFMEYSKRDQISFPYVLYKNGIKIQEIATLGDNVYKNYAIRKISHR